MKRSVCVVFVLLAPSAWAAPQTVKIKDCTISFKTRGQPVLVTIEGKSEIGCEGGWTVDGTDVKNFAVSMDLSKLNTGIPLRNKHLRENYLHTDKFPKATMTDLKAVDIDGQLKGTIGKPSAFKATLELHGKPAPISGTYQVKGGKQYSGEWDIDLPDFGVEKPSFMGVKVVDKVHLEFKFKVE